MRLSYDRNFPSGSESPRFESRLKRKFRKGRLIGSIIVMAMLLSSCGSGNDELVSDSTTSPPSDTSSASPTVEEEPEPENSDSDPTATTPTTPEPTTEPCREITHLMGTACVPANAQRIVALDPLTVLPTLIALDAPVIATVTTYDFGESYVDYLDPALLTGIELVGSFSAEPNLEAIAAMQPDLIIGSISRLQDHYDTLSQIAPTVVTGYAFYEVDWRKEILLTADAVGRLEAAETLLTELDTHIVETNAILTAAGAAPSLSRVDVWQGTPLYYQFACVWFGNLFTAAGVVQPEAQQSDCDQENPSSAIGYLSLETMDLLEADAIVAYQQQSTAEDEGADPTAALADSPLWSGLTPVTNGRVFVLGDAWGLGGSVQAAHQVLDDLVNIVFAET